MTAYDMATVFSKLFKNLQASKVVTPDRMVGIDFGTSAVKVVELERKDDLLALKTYGELQLGPYAKRSLGEAVELPLRERTEALVDVLRESGVGSSTGVLALPLSSSFVTVISLNAKAEEELGPRVKVEARKYIPIPLTDVSLDWTELPALPGSPATERDVLIAAVQNDAYADMNALMRAIKMDSQPTEVELFSAQRAVSQANDTAIAVIDLGGQTSKLYISQDGVLRKLHRVFAGGAQVTGQLATKLTVSFEEAENIKRNYNPASETAGEIKAIFSTLYERPLQEFKRVLSQYEARLGTSVGRVVITGGSASFAEMTQLASYQLDHQVERANAFNKVAYPAFMEDTLVEIAPIFTVALGAALRPYTL